MHKITKCYIEVYDTPKKFHNYQNSESLAYYSRKYIALRFGGLLSSHSGLGQLFNTSIFRCSIPNRRYVIDSRQPVNLV